MACPAGTGQKSGNPRCKAAKCDPIVDGGSCCNACPPGYFSAEDGDNVCSPCAAGTYSVNGYNGEGSTSCRACAAGKYSEEGSDHCIDCAPIFACSSKKGTFLDEQPDAPPPAPYTMEPFNTVGCGRDTMGEITTEQQCAAAAAYLGIDYATDGSNVKEEGVAHCFTKMGDAAGFAEDVNPNSASEFFAPICLGAGTDMGRRRLHSAALAVIQDGSSNVMCSGPGDAICDKCHIGYFGDGTPTCAKCPPMPA